MNPPDNNNTPALGSTRHLGKMRKTKDALELPPEEFIRWLSHRRGWHGQMYRAACSRYVGARLNPKPTES